MWLMLGWFCKVVVSVSVVWVWVCMCRFSVVRLFSMIYVLNGLIVVLVCFR